MTLRTRLLTLLLALAVVATTPLLAALLGIGPTIDFPKVAFVPPSSTIYTAATGALRVDAAPDDIDLGPPFGKRDITGTKSLRITITLDSGGAVTGPYSTADLELRGNIDLNGDG